MKKELLLLLGSMVFGFSTPAFAQQKEYFTNPVIRGDVADPSILRIGKTYYATGTSSEWAPYYPVFTSTDLVNWKQAGHIFDKQPEWTLSSFWAPELFSYRDKVYAYYTARRKSDGVSYIGVATAKDPVAGFTDHGPIVEYGTEAIDAFILEDKGQLYITWKAYGLDNRPIEILGSKLSDDGLRLEGEIFSLLKDDERIGMEGQHWFKMGDYYYMLYSVNGCCGPKSDYAVSVARSKSLKGPYEKYSGNPILHGGDSEVQSCGHGTFTTTPDGRMYYLFHAYLPGQNFFLGRQPSLQELVMGDDKWPKFMTGEYARLKQPVPFEGTVQQPVTDFEDTFKGNKLKLEWTWNYPFSDVKTQLKGGALSLNGAMKKEYRNGSALCVRPVSSHYAIETAVTNKNESFKGLTFYGDDKSQLSLGCVGNKLQLKSIIDGKSQLLDEQPLTASSVYLKMEVTGGCNCSFFWSPDGKKWQAVKAFGGNTEGLVQWDRVARPGLIHCGDADKPAVFSYFKMSNL
jgi:xylan 1,4-beta-xylosidase